MISVRIDDILAEFDHLVAVGRILYTPSQKILNYTDQGFDFEFRISPSLLPKPMAGDPVIPGRPTDGDDDWVRGSNGPLPGSDIDVSGYDIMPVLGTHQLAFNKYSMYRPHFLLLTQNPYRRQFQSLGEEDMQAAWAVLAKMKHRYFVIYNCTEKAGCSRQHKHMQLIPRPENGSVLFPDRANSESSPAPFQYFLHQIEDPFTPAKCLVEIYIGLLAQAKESLGISGDIQPCPHNVVLMKEWMMVIPRTKADMDGASANAAGMLGMVWVAKEEEMDRWMRLGPAEVLAQVGVASSMTQKVVSRNHRQ